MAPLPEEAEDDPAQEESDRLFEEGKLRYATSDYAGAVDLFRQSFDQAARIEDDDVREQATSILLFNLARAQIEAFKIDDDVGRLRQARDLLEKHLETQLSGEDADDAESIIVEIDALEEAYKKERDDKLPRNDPTPRPEPDADKSVSPLEAAGYATLAVAVTGGGFALAGGLLGNRAERQFLNAPDSEGRAVADRSGRVANGLLVGGSIAAGVFAITSVALITVGAKRRKASRSTARVTPLIGPPSKDGLALGIQVGGRF